MSRDKGIPFKDAIESLNAIEQWHMVVGVESDGYRGIPATYKLAIWHNVSENELQERCEKFVDFRVFTVFPNERTSKQWKELWKNKEEKNKEESERETYERLKKKFEPQPPYAIEYSGFKIYYHSEEDLQNKRSKINRGDTNGFEKI